MTVKLLPEHHLELLGLKGGCRGSSESTLVKMSNCWKSHAVGAQWLIGRVLDSRPRVRGIEPHWRHCLVVLEQDTFYLSLVLV